MNVKLFISDPSKPVTAQSSDLEKQVNDWINNNNRYEIIDVKYQASVTGHDGQMMMGLVVLYK